MDLVKQNPFQDLRARNIILAILVSVSIMWFIGPKRNVFGIGLNLIYFWRFWFHAVELIWVLWNLIKLRISFKRIIGRFPNDYGGWLITVGIAVLLVIFAVGSSSIKHKLISFLLNSPSPVRGHLKLSIFQAPFVIIVLPIVEELFFRGFLLHRWTVKWNIKLAILVSTFIFAIFHTNFIGALAYGFGLAALYIKTQTLMLPIFCHILINSLVFGFEVVDVQLLLTSRLWFGLLCLVLSVPCIAYLTYGNWPDHHWKAPYFNNYNGSKDFLTDRR